MPIHCSIKSQNHIIIWNGRDLKDYRVPTPFCGPVATHRSGLPTAPFSPALNASAMGHTQLHWAACAQEAKDICCAFGCMLALWLQQASDLTSWLWTQLWDWDFLIHTCDNLSLPWLQKWYKWQWVQYGRKVADVGRKRYDRLAISIFLPGKWIQLLCMIPLFF